MEVAVIIKTTHFAVSGVRKFWLIWIPVRGFDLCGNSERIIFISWTSYLDPLILRFYTEELRTD